MRTSLVVNCQTILAFALLGDCFQALISQQSERTSGIGRVKMSLEFLDEPPRFDQLERLVQGGDLVRVQIVHRHDEKVLRWPERPGDGRSVVGGSG